MGNRLAVMGATGAVGGELLKLIEERQFPYESIKLLASARSKGKRIFFNGAELTVEELTHESFKDVEIVLASASSTVSKEYLKSAT